MAEEVDARLSEVYDRAKKRYFDAYKENARLAFLYFMCRVEKDDPRLRQSYEAARDAYTDYETARDIADEHWRWSLEAAYYEKDRIKQKRGRIVRRFLREWEEGEGRDPSNAYVRNKLDHFHFDGPAIPLPNLPLLRPCGEPRVTYSKRRRSLLYAIYRERVAFETKRQNREEWMDAMQEITHLLNEFRRVLSDADMRDLMTWYHQVRVAVLTPTPIIDRGPESIYLIPRTDRLALRATMRMVVVNANEYYIGPKIAEPITILYGTEMVLHELLTEYGLPTSLRILISQAESQRLYGR